ncbi:SIR2 family protein [Terriglobus albidus]|uniref:SIR2 family protein n=1 Tax=Terriglobus albidus TaxID=1592106 RepID=UPI0021E0B99A|nr:SIR2 family protein [Terriglobus albidus]
MQKGEQILKSRDDKAPVFLVQSDDQKEKSFKVADQSSSSWLDAGESISVSQLRTRLEPWLTALFQSEHLALLVGSGLAHAVHDIATAKPLPGMSQTSFSTFGKEIGAEAAKSAKLSGREAGNIEDQLRTANELLRGLQIAAPSSPTLEAQAAALYKEVSAKLLVFANSIIEGEKGLISASSDKAEEAFNYLVSFLMSFGSRTGTRDRLHIFTTNYDRFIEVGAEVAGLNLMDRFVGSLSPIFRSSRLDIDIHYNPPGIRGEPRYLEGVAKITKLHGSIDWFDTGQSIRRIALPFGSDSVEPFLKIPGVDASGARQLMIFPNSAKDRETAAYPYVDLFRDLAASVVRPNSTVVCFGYSFGDEHINRVLEDMLTIPSTHLVVISHGDPLRRIIALYEKMGRPAQITLMIGDHLGDFRSLVDNYLPKPSIDRTTFRMADLLKARWTVKSPSSAEGTLGEDSF